jgi:hypothetical protein
VQIEEATRGTRSRSTNAGAPQRRRFKFDRCLTQDASQQDVFAAVDMPAMLAHCLQGFPVMVFAFGQTGAGKTHTILGAHREVLHQSHSGPLCSTPHACSCFNLQPLQLGACLLDVRFHCHATHTRGKS